MSCCRCGDEAAAVQVTAVESVRHMASTANHVVMLNKARNINVLHKDARFLTSDDMQKTHDLAVFEVSHNGPPGIAQAFLR